MAEYGFSYYNRIPEQYCIEYNELKDSLYSTVVSYLNNIIAEVYKNSDNIFVYRVITSGSEIGDSMHMFLSRLFGADVNNNVHLYKQPEQNIDINNNLLLDHNNISYTIYSNLLSMYLPTSIMSKYYDRSLFNNYTSDVTSDNVYMLTSIDNTMHYYLDGLQIYTTNIHKGYIHSVLSVDKYNIFDMDYRDVISIVLNNKYIRYSLHTLIESYRNIHDIDTFNPINVNHSYRDFIIEDNTNKLFIDKQCKDFIINQQLLVNRSFFDTYINIDKYNMYKPNPDILINNIIPVAKELRNTVIDKFNSLFIMPINRSIIIQSIVNIFKNKRNTNDTITFNFIVSDKRNTNVYFSEYYSIYKNKINTNNTSFNTINFHKNLHNIYTENILDFSIDYTDTKHDGLFKYINYKDKDTLINSVAINLNGSSKTVVNNDQVSCAEYIHNIKEYNKLLFASNNIKSVNDFNVISLYDSDNNMQYLNNVVFAIEQNKLLQLFPEAESIINDPIKKDIMMDDISWIDRIDEPRFIPGGLIDELLLPHEDFIYTNYTNMLIDNNGQPINPVRTINERTFIARLPKDHPIPEYSHVAPDYIELDVSLLSYMMRVFYGIWQRNIFKFGNMTMRDAVAKMLDYTDTFITYRMPEQLHTQAYRILRLFRWYGEYAILNNSEYLISTLYRPLKSDMYYGELMIPHTKTNLIVDGYKYILRNIDIYSSAELEMNLTNPVSTQISFFCSIYSGTLTVYINEVLIEELIEGGEYIYDINAGINNIKLVFSNQNYGIINIGNIIVKEYIFDSVTTEFVPKVGTGNTAINDIINKTMAYHFTLEENSELIQQVVNGNLAISDLVDKLIEYFESHHERKEKGKRLTIKK